MLPEESVLRRLPRSIPRRNILYLDGLRLSAQMAGIAYESLSELLNELSQPKEARGPLGDRVVRALLHAYSTIDSLHRFRSILSATPGLKHNHIYELFIRQTDEVETFRDIVQHLRREIDSIARNGLAALGTLNWLGPSKVKDGPPTTWILQPGTSYPDQITKGPLIDLESTLSEGIIDVSLSTSGKTIRLTEMVSHLKVIIKSIEIAVTEYSDGKGFFSSDMIMDFALVPLDGSVPGQGVEEQE